MVRVLNEKLSDFSVLPGPGTFNTFSSKTVYGALQR